MRSPPGEIYPVQIFIKYASMKKNERSIDNHLGCSGEFGRYSGPKVSRHFNLLTAISILLMAISTCSRHFQFTQGNFNLFTAISIYSRQFQLVHGNFNLLTAISICSRQFQFTNSNFNLLIAISIYSPQFQLVHDNFNLLTAISIFLTATLTAFFASLTTVQFLRPTVAAKIQNAKSKVDI